MRSPQKRRIRAGSGALRVCMAWTPEPGSRGRSWLEAASHVASSRRGDHGPPEVGGGACGPTVMGERGARLTVLQLYHLPPPFPRPVNNSSRLFTRYQSLYQLLCCTTVLFKVLYYKIKVVLYFLWVFFWYYLCEKYYKPIKVQHYS